MGLAKGLGSLIFSKLEQKCAIGKRPEIKRKISNFAKSKNTKKC